MFVEADLIGIIKEIMSSDGWWNIWDNMINFTGGVENLDFIVFSKFVRAVVNSENTSPSALKVLQENIEIYFSAIPDSVYDVLITGKSNSPSMSAARLKRYLRAYQSIVQSYCVDVLGTLGKCQDATEFLNNNEILDEGDIESQIFRLENPNSSPKNPTVTESPANQESVISSTTATDQPASDSSTEAIDPGADLPSTATTDEKVSDSPNSNGTQTSDVMVTVQNGVTMLRDQFRPLLPFFRHIQSYIPGILIVIIIVSAVFRRRQPSKTTFRRDVRLQRNQGLASQLFAKLIDTVKMGYNIT
ncbi:hypothetical protein BKA69DRAFT_1038974 [Paraphysoderma sedebokerense]|nr:hypothetical protein BKA69DRAFT_1038971 [Paraphysoderma sedebokerense]KAI9140794.1 hypothetical protein BKA69DRAFT_1038974 [Paraphysoderma sedebokerense]